MDEDTVGEVEEIGYKWMRIGAVDEVGRVDKSM